MTQAEYESKLKEYADSLGLRGVINDSVIKLLAYSINLKNSELNEKILNSLFSSTTNLNNRIAHAASLLYSVYRGTNPTVIMTSIVANVNNSYKYLDDAFQYNGVYYFFNQDMDTTQGQVYNVEYIVSDKPRQSVIKSIDSSDYHYIDFNNANISESIRIYSIDGNGSHLDTWTNDPYKFMSHDPDEIKYLIITIPNYGVRVLKRYNQDWDCTSLRLEYLNYYEVTQDVTNLRSIGDFVFDMDSSDSSSYKYIPRLESGEAIYMDATKTFMSRNQIGSITDVESIIEGTYDPGTEEYVKIYNIINSNNIYYVYVKCGELVRQSIQQEIDRRNPPYTFNVQRMNPRDVVIKCVLTNPSTTLEELNGYFNPLWQSYRSLTIDQMVTQILRYDTSLTSCSLSIKSGSLSNLESNRYFNITLVAN